MDIRTEAALAAFIPSLVFMGIVYRRDRYEREPKRLIVKLYIMSILACGIAIGLESAFRVNLSGGVATIISSAVGVGLIEEGAIFAVMVLVVRRSRQLNETVDGMVYASAVALGFAAIETFLYILTAFNIALAHHLTPPHASSLALTEVAPERAILGNLAHMAWSGLIGYAYARRRLGLGSRSQVLGAYLAAALLHAVYDGSLSLNAPTLAYASFAFSLGLYIHLFRHALAASPFRARQLRSLPPAPPSMHPAARSAAVAEPSRSRRDGVPAPPPRFDPNAVIPPGGQPVWAQPDASSHLIGKLEGGTGVQIFEHLGAWAHVLGPLGWSGWIDGRALLPVPSAPPVEGTANGPK